MGIAASLTRWKESHKRTFRIGAIFGLLIIVGVATFLPYATVSAGPVIPSGVRFEWVNEGRINVPGMRSDFVDANPYDTDRTFRISLGDSIEHYKNCTNLPNDDPGRIVALVPASPTSATLYQMDTANGPGPCAILTTTVTLRSPEKSAIVATPCPYTGSTAEARCAEREAKSNAQWLKNCFGFTGPTAPGACQNTAQRPPVGPLPGQDAGGTGEGDEPPPGPCDALGDFSFRWIACPMLETGLFFADAADAAIEDQLHYDTKIFDDTTTAGKNFKAAWNSFRTVGLSLMLIVGLIMVVSQAANLQIFDAYAFRKTLPRLLLAVIGIALSWEILQFVIVFFNDMGHWIQDLILAPFHDAATAPDASGGEKLGTLISSILLGTAATFGTGITLVTLGPPGILSVVITVVMAILVAFFVLLTRTAIITLAIITAPLAIACWVLPNTKKVWDLWQNALTTALFIFPIIMMLIASGKAMSLVSENGFMKILFLILPYVLLPFAFKLAGGLMSTIFSLTNDKSRGAFDRMSNMRRNAVKNRMQDAVQGTGKTWLSKKTGIARGVSGTLGNVYRRGHAMGQYGGIQGGFGATYAASRKGYGLQQVDEALKRDNGRAAGDDDANEIAARRGMTSEKFIREYSSLLQRRDGANEATAMQSAKAALGTFESSYGVRMGSNTGRVVAAKALLASNTALKPNQTIDGQEQAGGHYARAMETIGGLVSDGLINESDGAAIFKQNKMRNEFAQVGFGSAMKQIGFAAQKMRDPKNRGMAVLPSNEREAKVSGAQTVSQLTREALKGVQPGMLVGGRHETIDAVAPEMFNVIQEAANSNDESVVVKELAQTAGLHDSMSQGNRLNADRLDEKLLSQKIKGNSRFAGKTVRQAIDMLRGENNETFMNRRREYGAAASAQAQAHAAAAPGQGPPPPPVVTPG